MCLDRLGTGSPLCGQLQPEVECARCAHKPVAVSGLSHAGVQPLSDAVIRLGEVASRLSSLDAACNRCDRRGRLNTARLVAEHGPALPVPQLRHLIAADCPRMQADQMRDPCGVHFPQLPGLFR